MELGTKRKIVFAVVVVVVAIAFWYIGSHFKIIETAAPELPVIITPTTVQPTVVPNSETNSTCVEPTPTPRPTFVPTVVVPTPKPRCDIDEESLFDIPWEKVSGSISLEKVGSLVEKETIGEWSPGASLVVASKIGGYHKEASKEVTIGGMFSKFFYSENGRIHSLGNTAASLGINVTAYRFFLEGEGDEKLDVIIFYKGETPVAVGYGFCVEPDYIHPIGGDGGDGSSGGDSGGGPVPGPGPEPDGGGGPGPDPII